MNLDSASAIFKGGSMLWTRFLQKSQDGDVHWLNRTLLLPTTDRSGTMSARVAPHVFEEVAKGKNPDGKYWMEFDDSGKKFNLVDRVEERVPNSRQWLLRKFVGYTQPHLPPLLESRETLLTYLNERGLLFVPGAVVAVVRMRDPDFYLDLKETSMAALVKAAMPSTLLFLIAFHREIVWRRYPDHHSSEDLAERAADEFLDSFVSRKFERADTLIELLTGALVDVMNKVALLGDRCAPCRIPAGFGSLYPLPFLMGKDEETSDACSCLYAAGERWYERAGHVLPERYSEGAKDIPWRDRTVMCPSETSIRSALQVLSASISSAHERIAGEYEKSLLYKTPKNADVLVHNQKIDLRGIRPHPAGSLRNSR